MRKTKSFEHEKKQTKYKVTEVFSSLHSPWWFQQISGWWAHFNKEFPNWLTIALIPNLIPNPNKEYNRYKTKATGNQEIPC